MINKRISAAFAGVMAVLGVTQSVDVDAGVFGAPKVAGSLVKPEYSAESPQKINEGDLPKKSPDAETARIIRQVEEKRQNALKAGESQCEANKAAGINFAGMTRECD